MKHRKRKVDWADPAAVRKYRAAWARAWRAHTRNHARERRQSLAREAVRRLERGIPLPPGTPKPFLRCWLDHAWVLEFEKARLAVRLEQRRKWQDPDEVRMHRAGRTARLGIDWRDRIQRSTYERIRRELHRPAPATAGPHVTEQVRMDLINRDPVLFDWRPGSAVPLAMFGSGSK